MLPLIPIVINGLSIVIAGKGIKDTIDGINLKEEIKEIEQNIKELE
jgi:hypothetical protein